MRNWSAISIETGYHKCIIGYDLRTSLGIFTEAPNSPAFQSLGWRDRGEVATIDNQVWPEQIDSCWTDYQHGLNLFDCPLEKLDGLNPQINSIQVAFDLPITLANTLVSTFGVVLLPIELVAENSNWEFIGYDIVDVRTQCSGFYSFDWSEKEFTDILKRVSLKLNRNGLVDDEFLAIKASIAFDDIVKDHAPFAPCGIWISPNRDNS